MSSITFEREFDPAHGHAVPIGDNVRRLTAPNGGPFTAYPRILHLLMDKEARDREVAAHPKVAAERTGLAAIEREYTLSEVAQLTRSGPAKLLGLTDRGHLRPGARADDPPPAPLHSQPAARHKQPAGCSFYRKRLYPWKNAFSSDPAGCPGC